MEVISAIDIGSNAARLLIAEVLEEQGQFYYKKRSLVRVPLRLGQDVFKLGYLPEHKVKELLNTMKAYKLLMGVHHSKAFKACATSAMRDATNGEEVARMIRDQTGIKIHVIPGKKEAEILYATHFEQILDPHQAYMYIDVGGGSTEITLFEQGKVVNSRSFNIGTIRLLHNNVKNEQWEGMESWVKAQTHHLQDIQSIGSGGNINKLYKLNGRFNQKLNYSELVDLFRLIENHSFEERITKLGMRADRADVIEPAAKIFIRIMKWAASKEMHVPKFGLADGILRVIKEKSKVLS